MVAAITAVLAVAGYLGLLATPALADDSDAPTGSIVGRVLPADGVEPSPNLYHPYVHSTRGGEPIGHSGTEGAAPYPGRGVVDPDGWFRIDGISSGVVDLDVTGGWMEPAHRSVSVVAGATTDVATIEVRAHVQVTVAASLPSYTGDDATGLRFTLFRAVDGHAVGAPVASQDFAHFTQLEQGVSRRFDLWAPSHRQYILRTRELVGGVPGRTVDSRRVWLGATQVVVRVQPAADPITGVALVARGYPATFGIAAAPVPCFGPLPAVRPATVFTYRTTDSGRFTIPTMRGRCYAVEPVLEGGFHYVQGLTRVRPGTTDLVAYRRLETDITARTAGLSAGGSTVEVRVRALNVPAAAAGRPVTGTMVVREKGVEIGRARVIDGVATVRLNRPLTVGEHVLQFSYSGSLLCESEDDAARVSVRSA